jgi:hypothetical protein
VADTYDDLDLFAGMAPQAPQMPQNARKPAARPQPSATLLRPHTRYHSEIRLTNDPAGIIRVVSNERLKDFGLTWHPAPE